MKTLILSIGLTLTMFASLAQGTISGMPPDTIRIQVDSNRNAYYQRVVKVTSTLTVDMIFTRAIQFMAAKNFQQTYGYEQDGKLIFTTSQDLNINPVYVGDDNDNIEPYTVQFAIMLDIKHGSYRYTVHNVVFFQPVNGFNKRQTLFDLYAKATNTNSKRIARNAQSIIASFERYLSSLTQDLRHGVEQKMPMYTKFQ